MRVGFTVEDLRDLLPQPLDELPHGAAELAGLSRRKPQQARTIRIGEIVDVGEILRGRDPRFGFFEEPLDGGVASRADEPGQEDVVALPGYLQTEPDRSGRAVLADDVLERLDLLRCLEGELGRVAAPPQALGWHPTGRPGSGRLVHPVAIVMRAQAGAKPGGIGRRRIRPPRAPWGPGRSRGPHLPPSGVPPRTVRPSGGGFPSEGTSRRGRSTPSSTGRRAR